MPDAPVHALAASHGEHSVQPFVAGVTGFEHRRNSNIVARGIDRRGLCIAKFLGNIVGDDAAALIGDVYKRAVDRTPNGTRIERTERPAASGFAAQRPIPATRQDLPSKFWPLKLTSRNVAHAAIRERAAAHRHDRAFDAKVRHA